LVEELRKIELFYFYILDIWFPTKKQQSDSYSLYIRIYHK
jgi:hypothetical protein